jgi:hypothetical protein
MTQNHKEAGCWQKSKNNKYQSSFKIEDLCMSSDSSNLKNDSLCLDSGCTSHMCQEKNALENLSAGRFLELDWSN